jgi:DNA processing protein
MRAVDCDADEIAAWLRLLETPQVGRESARRLLAAFGSPQAVLAASEARRKEVVGSVAAHALSQAGDGHDALLALTLAWLAQTDGPPRHLVALGDPDYPAALLETADPPLLLYAIGSVELLRSGSLAIVGSRNPTPQGGRTRRLSLRSWGSAGLTIVSGLALGIDGAAHEGALDTAPAPSRWSAPGLTASIPKPPPRPGQTASRTRACSSASTALGTPPLAAQLPAAQSHHRRAERAAPWWSKRRCSRVR